MLIDSTVFASDELMTRTRFKSDPTAKHWSLCEKCELVVPPRSWHCDTCDVCVLKRDHHCMFASNCVGLSNHRHFLIFLLYFFIGTTYAFCYNSYFIWVMNSELFMTWSTALNMLLPMFMIFKNSGRETHLLYYMLIAIGSALAGVLLIFHGKLVAKNSLTHERSKGSYDMGLWPNMRLIFGSKWLMTLVWPFTDSPLPKIYWKSAESHKSK